VTSLRAEARRAHPAFPWLDAGDAAGIARFLRDRRWIDDAEAVGACGRAGEGNMNLTVRVRTGRRSVILKQARPWVERYDHIAAPWERSESERRFYERVAALPEVAARMPRLLAADSGAHALLLEDLGDAEDCTVLYRGGVLAGDELASLARYLAALHTGTRGVPDPVLANRAMRALNHAHVFEVPFASSADLGIDRFEPGLTGAAAALARDAELMRRVREAGERYLADGPCLVHGDFFPGSWLRTPAGMRIIDPEFAFYGDPELDVGCALAHLALARRPAAELHAFRAAYGAIDEAVAARYAGIEVLRRLLGVAQLPIAPSTGWRAALAARAADAVRDGTLAPLAEEP
jgi:5-methylthioribose kinase